jgi:hypothetical protein
MVLHPKNASLIESTSQNIVNFRRPSPTPNNTLENLLFLSEVDPTGHRLLTFYSSNFIVFIIVEPVPTFYKVSRLRLVLRLQKTQSRDRD